MKHFTIDNETNNITLHATAAEAEGAANAERFNSEASLAKLAMGWPTSRLIEIWNSLPGATPVRKFTDRKTAVSRIWKTIQSLAGKEKQFSGAVTPLAEEPATKAELTTTCTDVAAQSAHVAPAGETTPQKAARQPRAPQKAARPAKGATEPTGAPREGSKAAQVIAMLRRPEGTTVEEIMAAMEWQKHTTRALLSAGGSLAKKHGLTVVSEKSGDQRRYSAKP